jgi:hypothetical protein
MGAYGMRRSSMNCGINQLDYGFQACKMNVVWIVVVVVGINTRQNLG